MRTIDLDVLVLAAGKSERIQAITQGLPKPLLKLGDESVLERNLRHLARQGIRQVWINLHYKPEAIQATIGDGSRLGLTVRYSVEPQILGTAGAARQLLPHWTRTLLVVYGDSLVSFSVERLLSNHKNSGSLITLALFDQRTSAHTGIAGGRVIVANNLVTSFSEGAGETSASGQLVNAGVYLVERKVLMRIPPNSFFDFARDLFPVLIAEGVPLNAYVFGPDEFCLGIDTPDHFYEAQNIINSRGVKL